MQQCLALTKKLYWKNQKLRNEKYQEKYQDLLKTKRTVQKSDNIEPYSYVKQLQMESEKEELLAMKTFKE